MKHEINVMPTEIRVIGSRKSNITQSICTNILGHILLYCYILYISCFVSAHHGDNGMLVWTCTCLYRVVHCTYIEFYFMGYLDSYLISNPPLGFKGLNCQPKLLKENVISRDGSIRQD